MAARSLVVGVVWGRIRRSDVSSFPAIARHAAPGLLLVIVALLVFAPALRADFALIDDHEWVTVAPGAQLQTDDASDGSLWGRITVLEVVRGRFRPLHWVVRAAAIATIGPNPRALHLLTLALGIAQALLWLATLRRFAVAPPIAWLAAAMLLVTPGASMVWIRLGVQETIGAACIALACFAATVRERSAHPARWDAVVVGAGLAAALDKESFILALPALIAFRPLAAWLLRRGTAPNADRLQRWRDWPALSLGGAFLALASLAFAIARASGVGSDGGRYVGLPLHVFLRYLAANVGILDRTVGSLLALGAVGLWLAWRRRALHTWLGVAGVVLVLLVLQLALYSRSGPMAERYLFPALIGVVAATAALGTMFLSRCPRIVRVLILTCWGVWTGYGAGLTWYSADHFRAETVAAQRTIALAAAASGPGATVAIVADPVVHFEQSVAVGAYIAHDGRADLAMRLLPVAPSHDYAATDTSYMDSAALTGALRDTYFPGRFGLGGDDCGSIAAVVLFVSVERANESYPCLHDGHFRTVDSTESWGAGTGMIGYTVLVRTPMGTPALPDDEGGKGARIDQSAASSPLSARQYQR